MRKCLAFLFLAVAVGGTAPAQPPDVPVIRLPPEEMVPSGKMLLLADGVDWGVTKLNVLEAHKVTRGKGVKICVEDTGLDYTHPDFGEVPQSRMKSFVPGQSVMDVQGHGSHCTGRVAARGVNHGVAPEAEIWAAKVLGNDGGGRVDWIAAGIDWATASGVDVISLSLGGSGQDSYIPPAFARAEAAGVIIVAATGNSGPADPSMNYPGGYKQALGTAALDKFLNVARFSSRGANTFWCLPGVDVVSQYPGGRQAPMSGTSMATPHGAGLAALWIAANPLVPKKERPAAFRKAVIAASADLGPAGRDTAYGFGFVDAAKLVAAAPPPKQPDAIRFEAADFTPSGLEKLKLLNPKLDGLVFPLKP